MAVFEDVNKLVSNTDLPDAVNRKHVGLKKTAPFVKGYWYLYIDLPKGLKDDLKYSTESFRKLLAGLSVNFTPPGENLNFADVQHLGGTSKHYTQYTKSNDFSVTYNELSGAPVYKFHKAWARLIADSATSLGNIDVVPDKYKTTFLVIQTKPVGGRAINTGFQFKEEHIEKVYLLIGVTPPSDLQTGSFDSDISGPATVQLSYSYTCDDWYDDFDIPELKKKAADILNNKFFKWTKFADIKKLLDDTELTGSIFK